MSSQTTTLCLDGCYISFDNASYCIVLYFTVLLNKYFFRDRYMSLQNVILEQIEGRQTYKKNGYGVELL